MSVGKGFASRSVSDCYTQHNETIGVSFLLTFAVVHEIETPLVKTLQPLPNPPPPSLPLPIPPLAAEAEAEQQIQTQWVHHLPLYLPSTIDRIKRFLSLLGGIEIWIKVEIEIEIEIGEERRVRMR